MSTNVEEVTQAMFNKLPGLLTPAMMRLVTGLDDRGLEALIDAGTIRRLKLPVRKGCQRSYCKYYKTDAAKLTGFKL